MTPQPPSSSEGSSLPPRHRPALGSLSQDTTELDLWAFDDEADEVPEPVAEETPRGYASNLPAPRERASDRPYETGASPAIKPAAGEDLIRMNVNKTLPKSRSVGPLTGPATPEGDFDDLEPWDPPSAAATRPLPPAVVVAEPAPAATPPPVAQPPEVTTPEVTAPEVTAPEVTASKPAQEVDEFSPVVPEHAVPVSLRPHWQLSAVERIGLIGLLALLLVGGGAMLVFSLTRLPSEPKRAKVNDFPIQGARLTITSAKSYWRAPKLAGPAPDMVRRGTELLPVLEIQVSGGPAAVRVLFRNAERAVVGDAVTRPVSGGGTLQIPATAGFDDLGMHAAYRTGESKPWTIEVLEAASEDTAGQEFKKLFELNISTDRR